jgi:hypothetical protein
MLTPKPSSAIVIVGPEGDVCEVPVGVIGGSLVEWSSMVPNVPNVSVLDVRADVWKVDGAVVESRSGDPGLDGVVTEVADVVVLLPGDENTAAALGWAVPSIRQAEMARAIEVPRASPVTNVRQPFNVSSVSQTRMVSVPVGWETGRVFNPVVGGKTGRLLQNGTSGLAPEAYWPGARTCRPGPATVCAATSGTST